MVCVTLSPVPTTHLDMSLPAFPYQPQPSVTMIADGVIPDALYSEPNLRSPKDADNDPYLNEQEFHDMMSYLDDIKKWKGNESNKSKSCTCKAEAFSPSAVHTCSQHTPAKQNRDFDRVRTQTDWQIEMVYEQPLLCFDLDSRKFVTVNVLNGFRTHSDYNFVAISHLWPKPLDDEQERGDSQTEVDLQALGLTFEAMEVEDFKVHKQYEYSTKEIQFAEGDNRWVKTKVEIIIKAVKSINLGPKTLVWLDLVSVDQGNAFAIRDATYAMSIAYHISDLTLVVLDPTDSNATRWLGRRWTLQELELAHDIKFVTSKFEVLESLPDVQKARKKRGKHDLASALQESVRRKSKYPQDIVYAVRGLVPPLFSLPVVYDIDVYTLILRAATVCAKKGDYSLLDAECSGLPAGSLICNFWKQPPDPLNENLLRDIDEEHITRKGIQVAPLANLTGCGLIFERQRTARLKESDAKDLEADRVKRKDMFTECDDQDGGDKAAESIKKFEDWIRQDFGASNISLACRNALADIAKGIHDVFKLERCESFDTNTAEVCESMLSNKPECKKILVDLLKKLILADSKHPLAVKYGHNNYTTWVLKSDVTKYEFIMKGISFIKSLFESAASIEHDVFVLVMRGERNDAALKFVAFKEKTDAGWMVISQSEKVSYADSAAVVKFNPKEDGEVRIRTQRGVALMVQANECEQVEPDSNQFKMFGVDVKRLLFMLVNNGAGQKSPVVVA
ncbi:hypothetical protein BC830DRAFT_1167259 [Chytriomyces sp. MP71]|nr:hypothetical protein BC830DRAFT_1167259 [Chytriomyces sp. MP71]